MISPSSFPSLPSRIQSGEVRATPTGTVVAWCVIVAPTAEFCFVPYRVRPTFPPQGRGGHGHAHGRDEAEDGAGIPLVPESPSGTNGEGSYAPLSFSGLAPVTVREVGVGAVYLSSRLGPAATGGVSLANSFPSEVVTAASLPRWFSTFFHLQLFLFSCCFLFVFDFDSFRCRLRFLFYDYAQLLFKGLHWRGRLRVAGRATRGTGVRVGGLPRFSRRRR